MARMTTSTKPKAAKPAAQAPQQHSDRAHALLSASGANRWLNCTPSARLEDKYGEHKTSVYAEEGTLAHEMSELYIRHDVLDNITPEEFDAGLERIMAHELFNSEMLDVVPIYVEYVATETRAAKEVNPLATTEIEQVLDLTEYVPESFGTADCVIINDDVMEVIDLKYGKGVPVYATHNKQLMLYGLGALRKYDTLFDIKKVKLTIVQPRINNISTWEISVEDLLDWAVNELKPAAELAFSGGGELKSGDWCKFCSLKNKCKALADEQLKMAKYEFADPEMLTDEEVADVLKRVTPLIEWANSVHEYALKQALENKKIWPGYKLVEGTSRRKWIDEDKVAEAIFERFPEASEDDIFDMKLKTITNIEKLYGKKVVAEKLSDMIVKPQGKPTLVPAEDKRPALGVEDAINDFK